MKQLGRMQNSFLPLSGSEASQNEASQNEAS